MAYTNFLYAKTVTQTTGSDEISWTLDRAPNSLNTNSIITEPLTSFNEKQTGLLKFSNFDLPGSISTVQSDGSTATTIDGIEVKIEANKDNRVIDSIIRLTLDGTLSGSNKADTSAGGIHTYGSSTDVWGTTIAQSDLATLGVAIKYKSDTIPHKDTCKVWNVQIRIHYT